MDSSRCRIPHLGRNMIRTSVQVRGGALAGTRERRSAHDPGRVLCDLAVMAGRWRRCVSDLAALQGQPALFGEIASVSTARRVLLSIGQAEIDRVRQARAVARARAWGAGAASGRVILDFRRDADQHPFRGGAGGRALSGGFGFNPLLVTCRREVLTGVLRPGNTGADNASDPQKVRELALEQLPESALDGDILAPSDSAGTSHDFAFSCRETRIRFSLGYPINSTVREQILALGEDAWEPAINQDAQPREGAWVTELTGFVNLDSWPEGTQLICRRERPHPARSLHRGRCELPTVVSPCPRSSFLRAIPGGDGEATTPPGGSERETGQPMAMNSPEIGAIERATVAQAVPGRARRSWCRGAHR
jgi:hypothetical protein